MNPIPDLPVDILVGVGGLGKMHCQPLPPYAEESINFLTALSKRLLKHRAIRTYPDIAGFAYWCRPANLARLSRNFRSNNCRIGRGLVLHIAPANVPVTFAFSLAFGQLAGNANIVRISDTITPQATLICEEIATILNQPQHSRIAAMTRVIRYPREDTITAALSAVCQARVLWGGDGTISHFRSIKTSPRCVDICFADRYSICILGAEGILKAPQEEMELLISGFYNDAYLLDQNACSSPHLIIWQGNDEEIFSAKIRFWEALDRYLQAGPNPPPNHAVDKFNHLCRTAILLQGRLTYTKMSNLIFRVELDDLPKNLENHRGQYGFFIESTDNDLICLESIVNERYQTVTYFGIDPQSVLNIVTNKGLTGIDRVVPVGKALEIGPIWDGFDLIGLLSRIISRH